MLLVKLRVGGGFFDLFSDARLQSRHLVVKRVVFLLVVLALVGRKFLLPCFDLLVRFLDVAILWLGFSPSV